jgi:hypothetical protein
VSAGAAAAQESCGGLLLLRGLGLVGCGCDCGFGLPGLRNFGATPRKIQM